MFCQKSERILTISPQYCRPILAMVQKRLFSTPPRSNYLIETNELQNLLDSKSKMLRLIDASYYLPESGLNAKGRHEKHRITRETQYFSI